MATAGLICGIVGIVACWVPLLGALAGLLGVIFSAIGMGKAGRLGGVGRGAGIAGLVCGILSLLLLPIMAAIAIPAFLDYMQKSKQTESSLHLGKLERRIKGYYNERAELPPSAGEMPGPAGTACAQPTHKFPALPIAEYLEDPGWAALDFYVAEPTPFTFKWTRDSATAGHLEAIADLDCDMHLSTLRYDIVLDHGELVVTRQPATPD